MRYLLIAALLAATSACSPDFYCKRCKLFGNVKPDTAFATKDIPVPGENFDTLFVAQPGDTVFIKGEDRVRIKFIRLPGDTVLVGCNCEPDTVKVEVPILVTNEIKTGVATGRVWWLIASSVVIALILGLLLGGILRKIYTKV